MEVWDVYNNRLEAHGITKRDASFKRETRMVDSKSRNNLSYTQVTIDDVFQRVTIINSDNLNEKTVISLPMENIRLGGLVHWMNNYWLVTERDANTSIYTKAKMIQCNHLLKWVSDDNVIHEQWCVIEDGTKYLTGEYEDRNFVVTRGDSRISMTIARNEHTVNFGREHRFLIDDSDAEHKLAYLLTKPLKIGLTYNNEGVFKFILQEVASTDDDNHELGIADYYKHFQRMPDSGDKVMKSDSFIAPNNNSVSIKSNTTVSDNTGKKVWL